MELPSPSQDSLVKLNEIQSELAMCRSALEIASHKATLITQDGKSTVLSHINAAFAALLTLASHVSGDYDSRSRDVSKTGPVGTLPTLLWTSAKDALTKSDAVAIAAKTEFIMVCEASLFFNWNPQAKLDLPPFRERILVLSLLQ